jgi:DNA-directed RNA polymerase specialized sigma24 family protein
MEVETEIRWTEVQGFLKSWFARRCGSAHASHVDDLTQEACIRLLRMVRREAPRDLEAAMGAIAHRTWIDHLRRHLRWKAVLAPWDETVEQHAAAPDAADPDDAATPAGDPVTRLRFMVLEFFRAQRAECYELGTRRFGGQDWRAISAAVGRGYAAVRQAWSRCMKRFRETASGLDEDLLRWVDG